MNFDTEAFAKAVKTHRVITLGTGLREVAKKTKISAATLSRIENGSVFDVNMILKLCEWMGIHIDNFFVKSNKKK